MGEPVILPCRQISQRIPERNHDGFFARPGKESSRSQCFRARHETRQLIGDRVHDVSAYDVESVILTSRPTIPGELNPRIDRNHEAIALPALIQSGYHLVRVSAIEHFLVPSRANARLPASVAKNCRTALRPRCCVPSFAWLGQAQRMPPGDSNVRRERLVAGLHCR